MKPRSRAQLALAAILCATSGLTLAAANAEARSRERQLDGRGTVTACSRYGNGCYSAPTRQARFGLEMRLKGGTWIDCRGSCKNTLREETVDFWDTQRERAPNGR